MSSLRRNNIRMVWFKPDQFAQCISSSVKLIRYFIILTKAEENHPDHVEIDETNNSIRRTKPYNHDTELTTLS